MLTEAKKIAFLGCGNMGGAILKGLLAAGISGKQLYAIDRNAHKCANFRQQGVSCFASIQELADASIDALLICVKPQVGEEACKSLAAHFNSQATQPLYLSVMAGVTVNSLNKWLSAGGSHAVGLIRAMPNTPSLIAEGACGLFANSNVTAQQKQLIEEIMNTVGVSRWVSEEHLIDVVTALAGSAPAYFFYLIESMEKVAVEKGLDPQTARDLAVQTAYGAASLAKQTCKTPEELRKAVMSKGGTTQAAIEAFQKYGFQEVIEKGMDACISRAEALSQSL